jgi:hypothetical protein
MSIFNKVTKTFQWGQHTVVLETGEIARQSSGAVVVNVEDTVILSELDVIGINAFFPLSKHRGATFNELVKGGRDVAQRVGELARSWRKPVVFTEIGYTTRPDPAFEPWTWPDKMTGVVVDQRAQADAYTALLLPMIDEPWFVGAFVWRLYADPDDMSQEAEWGFSPRGKLAEQVVRSVFGARWGADGPLTGTTLANFAIGK